MSAHYLKALALVAACMVQTSTALAADFSYKCTPVSCKVQLKGTIKQGDSEKFVNVIRNLRKDGRPIESLSLLSPGGDVSEAIEIGRIVRKSFIFTFAPLYSDYLPLPENLAPGSRAEEKAIKKIYSNPFGYLASSTLDGTKITNSKKAAEATKSLQSAMTYDQDALCASACALIAISGLIRFGTVGLHHLSVENKNIDYDDLDKILSQGNDEVATYLAEVRAPRSFLEDIVSTPSKEIKWVNLSSIGSTDPIFREWELGKCGGLTDQQIEDRMQLLALRDIGLYFSKQNEMIKRSITKQERRYLEELEAISEVAAKCRGELYLEAQRRAQGLD